MKFDEIDETNFKTIILNEIPVVKRGMLTWLPPSAVLLAKERGYISKDEALLLLENIKKRDELLLNKNVEEEIAKLIKQQTKNETRETSDEQSDFEELLESKKNFNNEIPF